MKPKILWLSDSPLTTTGFATITRNILNSLTDEFECHCIGHNYPGVRLKPPVKFEDNTSIKFHLHGQGVAKYSMDLITNKIRSLNIDIFGGLLDTFMMYEAGFMSVDTSPAKTFFYYPSDGGGCLPRDCENILRKVQVPIAMSKFARDQVKKIYGINSVYIPHAFDKKVFYPLSSEKKLELRKKWGLTDKFVIGVVARNQGRKTLDKGLKAFARFCKDKPDAVLFMHTDPNDMAQVFSLNHLIKRFKINNRVIFTGTSFFNPYSYKEMNDIYNLMDIFFLPTSGEGFGVPIIEAMAAGIPQVVTDYTTTKELVEDDIRTGEAVLLSGETEKAPYPHTDEVIDGSITGSWDVERGTMSVYDGEKVLTKLYNDRKLLEKYSRNSIEKAKGYTWEKIMPQWRKVLWEMHNE